MQKWMLLFGLVTDIDASSVIKQLKWREGKRTTTFQVHCWCEGWDPWLHSKCRTVKLINSTHCTLSNCCSREKIVSKKGRLENACSVSLSSSSRCLPGWVDCIRRTAKLLMTISGASNGQGRPAHGNRIATISLATQNASLLAPRGHRPPNQCFTDRKYFPFLRPCGC